MKWALFSLLFSFNLWAKPLVLISHFDAFGKAPFNNSERVARALKEKFKNHPEVRIELCSVQTIFNKAYAQLEDCLKAQTTTPTMVLGLGEATCNLKIEFLARNLDQNTGPDNAGIVRSKTKIIPEGPLAHGFSYPLDKMYCALPANNRRDITVSNNAGSFVCNNLAYLFAHYYPEETFGFIHVPSHDCKNLKVATDSAIANLSTMILAAARNTKYNVLPTTKKQIKDMREASKNNACLSEFYSRAKGIDEKGLWPF